MACYIVPYYYNPLLFPPNTKIISRRFRHKVLKTRLVPPRSSAISDGSVSYNTLISEAVRILVPQANFDSSKLEVLVIGEELLENKTRGGGGGGSITPRAYILSHCDFTANLTLTISNVINLDQLEGWYKKDDVVAEWKKVKDELRLHIHCCVSGSSLLQDVAAELRYHIFSKELPLVLKAVIHGDEVMFRENPELMDAYVWVYFHSSSPKYNRIESWGPLKDAAKGMQRDNRQGFVSLKPSRKLIRTKSIFHTLFTFLL